MSINETFIRIFDFFQCKTVFSSYWNRPSYRISTSHQILTNKFNEIKIFSSHHSYTADFDIIILISFSEPVIVIKKSLWKSNCIFCQLMKFFVSSSTLIEETFRRTGNELDRRVLKWTAFEKSGKYSSHSTEQSQR